ncbi:MAG: enoyl-CoA hydratase/isomerase family protein [Halodesulfurarchaeum sp.]
MSTYDNFRLERDGAVAVLTIDSESRLNALNPEMGTELLELTSAVPYEDEVRAVVLTAHGDAFGAGADLSRLSGDERDSPVLRKLASQLHDAVSHLHRAPVPVLTGVNGIAAGGGFSLALVGDIVLVSDEARLEFAYPRLGLTGDGGSTFALPRLVGLRRAKEIALRDEPIDPERAVELGLATEVVPDDELHDRVREEARRLASGPTWALGRTRRLLAESFSRDLESQLAAETEAIAGAAETEDFARGYAAFFGEDDPEFVGR